MLDHISLWAVRPTSGSLGAQHVGWIKVRLTVDKVSENVSCFHERFPD